MRRTLLRFGTAPLLGLPAALLAHAFVFGDDHAAGGAAHIIALAAAAVFGLAALALHTGSIVQGSILASRLQANMPRLAPLAVSAGAWYALLEACEPHHTFNTIAVALAVFAASLLVRGALSLAARTLRSIVVAFCGCEHYLQDAFNPYVSLAYAAPLRLPAFAHSRRLFSRPPPHRS